MPCSGNPGKGISSAQEGWELMSKIQTHFIAASHKSTHALAPRPRSRLLPPPSPFPIQSRVKTFLPGSGNGWLKCCALVQFWGLGAEHFESDSQNLGGMFYTTLYKIGWIWCNVQSGASYVSQYFFMFFHVSCEGLPGQ